MSVTGPAEVGRAAATKSSSSTGESGPSQLAESMCPQTRFPRKLPVLRLTSAAEASLAVKKENRGGGHDQREGSGTRTHPPDV